jgi:stearoyl-CoA desaturase (delta-9 desaturase)
MDALLYGGVFDLPWWGYALVALGLTHVTIIAVTIFLHRHQAHRALALHPLASHLFRLWLWLTTGMVTREWAAVHRKHHAKCDTADDPHSPQVYGINRVLWLGVFLYVKEARKAETLERYGHGTPDDWLERNLYSRFQVVGIVLTGAADVLLFGIVPGGLILLTQVLWIPFWAAGVVNGVGHYLGYRNWPTPDWSTNIVPWGVLIGGEELHNNHHAFPTSAKLSCKWFEFDIGWMYIVILEALGLARVKHVAPTPHVAPPKPAVDPVTLQAVIAYRYDLLARYAGALRQAWAGELRRLRERAPDDARLFERLGRWLGRDEKTLREAERKAMAAALPKSPLLQTMVSMRCELAAIWGRSSATREQLVGRLQEWCRRAETSGIGPLKELAERMRSYA